MSVSVHDCAVLVDMLAHPLDALSRNWLCRDGANTVHGALRHCYGTMAVQLLWWDVGRAPRGVPKILLDTHAGASCVSVRPLVLPHTILSSPKPASRLDTDSGDPIPYRTVLGPGPVVRWCLRVALRDAGVLHNVPTAKDAVWALGAHCKCGHGRPAEPDRGRKGIGNSCAWS